MKGSIPTEPGDVLILATEKAGSTHAVGAIIDRGQQDFRRQTNLKYVSGRSAAISEAKKLVMPAQHVYLRNDDTGDWEEV